MIVGVFGLPGAGKSTFLTWLILRALNDKPLYIGHLSFKRPIGEVRHYKRVFSNIPIDGTYKLDFDHLGKYDFSDSLIVIDEIGTLCDSRKWKDFDDGLRDFMSLHRHYNCTLVYCSQAPPSPINDQKNDRQRKRQDIKTENRNRKKREQAGNKSETTSDIRHKTINVIKDICQIIP